MTNSGVRISVILWGRLVRELRKRGRGERESGAFLLGRPGSGKITKFICYDDLDERALESGIITFHGPGFVELWNRCEREKLRVMADAHTHPSSWVDQSNSDRTHPMVAQKGHISLILPNYGFGVKWTLKGVGIHEYLCDHRWKSHIPPRCPIQISLYERHNSY
jgi:hypothetical protein